MRVRLPFLAEYANGVRQHSPGLRFCERSEANRNPGLMMVTHSAPGLLAFGGEAAKSERTGRWY